MAFYSNDIIAKLKDYTDIADVIQQFVPLKPAGTNRYTGRCPFHDDRSPSMSVNSTLGIYKCFACNAGGDVFKFIMEHEKIDFRSAIEWVAHATGFALPKLSNSAEKNETLEERELVKQLNVLATEWFEQNLTEAPEIKAYLDKRGISEETQKIFHFGFAPNKREGLLAHAIRKGFSPRQLVQAGLAVEKEHGGIADKFRDRLMIPIQNISGTVIAFGGRVLQDQAKTAKYMNSPKTILYEKGEVLFGLHQCRQGIAKAGKVIIVEGYFDVISLYQAGIQNVVAASGTALTEAHASLLSRYAKTAYLVFDGDSAGKEATKRSLEKILSKSMSPKIYSLSRPNGEKIDPDNFIREQGPEAFLKELESAEDWLTYLIKETPHSNPEDKAKLIHHTKSLISTIPDVELQRQYLNILAERLGTEASFRGLKNSLKNSRSKIKSEETNFETETPPIPWHTISQTEIRYLNLILQNPAVLKAASLFYDFAFVSSGISLLESPLICDILGMALLQVQETGSFNLKLLSNSLSEEGKEILFALPEENWNENAAIKEFLEMTLDFEKRFIERLRLKSEDIDLKLELTNFASKLKRLLVESKKTRTSPNNLLQQILDYRNDILLFNQTLQGN